MTRADRLAELIREDKDRWFADTGYHLDGQALTAYLGMSPAEYFADQLDAEGYEPVAA